MMGLVSISGYLLMKTETVLASFQYFVLEIFLIIA